MTPILDRARAAMPGYAELTAAQDVITARTAELRLATPAPAEIIDAALGQLLAGDGLPADLGDRLRDAEQASRAAQLEAEALGVRLGRDSASGLLGRLHEDRRNTERCHVDAALAVLRDELDDVLAHTAAADDTLAAVDTAEAAVAGGAETAAAWAALAELVDRYDALRVAQHELLAASGRTGDRHSTRLTLESAGYLENAADLDPFVRQRITDEAAGTDLAGRPIPLRETTLLARASWPAPEAPRGAGHWPTHNRPAYLRWLTVSAARPWVPTVEELLAKDAEHQQAARNTATTTQGITRGAGTLDARLRKYDRITGGPGPEPRDPLADHGAELHHANR